MSEETRNTERPERSERSERPSRPFTPKKKFYSRRKFCRFCADENAKIDYKDTRGLRHYITERGKIVPRRISGTCAPHQRKVAEAIKQARNLALIPLCASHN